MNKAVADSARQVIVFGRSLASAVYSANGGGFSASREEGFGTTGAGYPYLRPAPLRHQEPAAVDRAGRAHRPRPAASATRARSAARG